MNIYSALKRYSENFKQSIYINIFSAIVISVAATVLVLTAILYMNFERIMQISIYNSEKNSLAQTGYSISILDESARTLLKQIYSDKDISKLMYYPAMDSQELTDGIRKLSSYQATTPFVSSVYVYNAQTGLFYISALAPKFNIYAYSQTDFYDKPMVNFLKEYELYSNLIPVPRKIPLSGSLNDSLYTTGYTYIYYDANPAKDIVNNAIFLNVSEAWLRNILKSIDGSGSQYNNVLIVDGLGRIVTNTGEKEILTDISSEPYIRDILNSQSTSGYMIKDIDGTPSLVIFLKSDFLDWILVRTIPYGQITEKLNGIKEKTIIFSLLILIAGIGISIAASKMVYKPINKLEKKLKSLEIEKKGSSSILKQNFLRELLTGEAEFSMPELEKQISNFSISDVFLSGVYTGVILVDRYEEFCGKYNINDRSLMKFAIMNIASEILSQACCNELSDIGDSNMAIILHGDDQDPEFLTSLRKSFQEIQFSVQKYLHLSISIALCNERVSLADSRSAFNRAMLAATHRLLLGYQCIIFTSDIGQEPKNSYIYPGEQEKEMLNALILGKAADVKRLYDDIVRDALNVSIPAFHLTLAHLAFIINSAAGIIRENSGQSVNFNFNAFMQQIARLETIDEINKCFYALYDSMCSMIDNRKGDKLKNLLNSITEIINENYMDPNLSLQSISDILGMSPVYVSRTFRKLTSKSIVDIINEVRIEKAKVFLIAKDATISDIAEKTGYTNDQYFYRVFKKISGVTPNEYRSNHP